MARKKAIRPSDDHKQVRQENPTTQVVESQQHNPTMAVSSETLERLKSLNGLLLKETADRRQQVESLVHAKEGLQSELTQSQSDKESLMAQLADSRGQNVELQLQKGVLSAFVETQLSDLTERCEEITREKAEIESIRMDKEADIEVLNGKVNGLLGNLLDERNRLSEAISERDNVKRDLDGLVAESNGLKDKVMGMGSREGMLRDEVQKLRTECEGLMEEADERKLELQGLMAEKELAVKKLADSELIIMDLKERIVVLLGQKNESEEEKNAQLTKIIELERQVEELDKILLSKQREEEASRANILDLEKTISEATRKEKEMEILIGSLQEVKEKEEQCIKNLKDEIDAVQKSLTLIENELERKQERSEEITKERDSLGQLNLSKENEIIELRDEACELNNEIHKLREACKGLKEENKELIFVVDNVKADLSNVKNERDLLKSNMDEQGGKVVNLTAKVSELEKNLGQTKTELSKVQTHKKELVDTNKVMESHVQSLVGEKDKLLKSLREAKEDFNHLSAKVELAATNSSRAMFMLKNTAAVICQSKDYNDNGAVLVNEKKLEEEMEPFAHQLDAIKDAFNRKLKMVEEMEEKIASLRKSVAESQKKKSFLTVLSSATTIFAAASVAYVARGR